MVCGHLASEPRFKKKKKTGISCFTSKTVNSWLRKVLPSPTTTSKVKTLFRKINRLFFCYQLKSRHFVSKDVEAKTSFRVVVVWLFVQICSEFKFRLTVM